MQCSDHRMYTNRIAKWHKIGDLQLNGQIFETLCLCELTSIKIVDWPSFI